MRSRTNATLARLSTTSSDELGRGPFSEDVDNRPHPPCIAYVYYYRTSTKKAVRRMDLGRSSNIATHTGRHYAVESCRSQAIIEGVVGLVGAERNAEIITKRS